MDANFVATVIAAATDRTDEALEAAARKVWPSTRPASSRAQDPFLALAQNGSSKRSYKAPCAPELGVFGSHSAKCPQTKQSHAECAAVKRAILGKLRDAYELAQASARG